MVQGLVGSLTILNGRWSTAQESIAFDLILSQALKSENITAHCEKHFIAQAWSNHICKCVCLRRLLSRLLTALRKYEHSKTFGVVTSNTSNVLWCPDDNTPTSAFRPSGAGRAIVGAEEDVVCWDIKKGELLNRWKDPGNNSEVTVITRSGADVDIFAVGYVVSITAIL